MGSKNQKRPQLPSIDKSGGGGSPGPSSTSNATTSWLPAQLGNAAVCQKCHSHSDTLPQAAWWSQDNRGLVLAACSIGGLVIYSLVRIKTGGTIPPHTWARTVDQQTRDEVEATLAVGLNMARNSAPHQRNDALREATCQVPHELARLNKDAPDFNLEELRSMVHSKKMWDRLGEHFPSLAPFVDCAEEARVFLYFPNGATKATAIFVAVNAELKFPFHKPQESVGGGVGIGRVRAAVRASLFVNFWEIQHRIWAQRHPAVIGRVDEMERLPMIFNFRDKTFGALYYTRLGVILDTGMCATPLNLWHLDRGILHQ